MASNAENVSIWWRHHDICFHRWITDYHHLASTAPADAHDVTMAADVLALGGARTSAAMVFAMYDKLVIAFHEEGFQLLVPSDFREIIEYDDVIKWRHFPRY